MIVDLPHAVPTCNCCLLLPSLIVLGRSLEWFEVGSLERLVFDTAGLNRLDLAALSHIVMQDRRRPVIG